MKNTNEKNNVEKLLNRLRDNKIISLLIVFGVIITAISTFTDSFVNLCEKAKTIVSKMPIPGCEIKECVRYKTYNDEALEKINERKYKEAENLLKAAIKNDKQCWIPYYNIARLYLIKDNRSDAISKAKIKKYLEKAKEKGMDHCKILADQKSEFILIEDPWFEDFISDCNL